MATQLSMSDCAFGASLGTIAYHTARPTPPVARTRPLAWSSATNHKPVTCSGPLARPLVTVRNAVTCSGPLARPLVALRNPARHGVTHMAPQDFPLCAAFQEE